MRVWGYQVSKKLEKTGGEAIINEDMSVSIIMDGKVQEVIPADDRRMQNDNKIVKNAQPRQHLRLMITKLVEKRDVTDYNFYTKTLKPLIKDFNPSLYKILMNEETKTRAPFGV